MYIIVSYVAPMSYHVHVPHMYCIDLHVPVLYMYVSTVDLVVDLVWVGPSCQGPTSRLIIGKAVRFRSLLVPTSR